LVNQIERGVITDPHYSTLVGIANALDMSVGDLLGEESAVPLGEPPSGSPSPEETTGPGRWERIRKLSPQAKQGIRDYLKARADRTPKLGTPEGDKIKAGFLQALEELAEAYPELEADPLGPYSDLAFVQRAPAEVVADVLRDEDTQQADDPVARGFIALLFESVKEGKLTDDELWQRLTGVGRAWRALSPSV